MPSSLTNLRTHTLLYHTHILTSSTYYPASPNVAAFRVLFAFAFASIRNYDCWGYCIHLYGNFASIKYFQVARVKTHSHIFSSTSTIFFTDLQKTRPHHSRTHENIYIHTHKYKDIGKWKLHRKGKKSSKNDVILNDS